MSGRFAIIGLTALALLALGAGTSAVPGSASAEFSVPGIFSSKKVVKRRRHHRPPPVQPVRNPDRTFAVATAKTVSPDVAKHSDAALAVGTASAASVVMALPTATRVAAKADDPDEGTRAESKPDETANSDADSADAKASDTDATATAESSESNDAKSNGDTAESSETKPDPDSTADAKSKAGSPDGDATAAADASPADAESSADEVAETDKSEAATDTAAAADESDDLKSADATPEDDTAADAKSTDNKSSDSKSAETATEDDKPDAKAADSGSDKADADDADSKTAAEAKPSADEADALVAADDAANDSKTTDSEAAAAESADSKSAAATAADDKTADSEAADAKSADAKSSDAKSADAKSGDAKTAEADTKRSDTKSAAAESTGSEAEDVSAADEKATEEKTAADKSDDATASERKAEDEPQSKSAEAEAPEATETASVDASAKPEDGADKEKLDKAADTAAKEPDAAQDTARDEAETAAKSADIAAQDAASAKDGDAEESEVKQADAENADAKGSDAKESDARDTETDTAGAEDAASTEADAKDVADTADEPAEKADTSENETVTASLPPVPLPKPEIARMASPANTPERLAESAEDAQDADVTASISPISKPEGGALSEEAADGTGMASKSTEAPTEEKLELDPRAVDPRAYDDTVVLDILPPPGTEADAKIAALETGTTPLAESGSASEGTAEAVDLGPPPPPPVDPVIESVRATLDGPAAPKVAAADLEALQAFYGERDDDPIWVEGDGLTQKAKALIATIRDADDWALDADAYAVPGADSTLTTDEARADAELALSAAILKYARHAQTGRLTPASAHKLFDFNPTARDPKTVLTELAASDTPDKALLALHPQSEQYQRLHTALVHARDTAKDLGRDPDNDRTVQLIAINMERWRWLPSNLGNFHVWNNIPEFKFRVLKGGRTIYEEKTIVGQTQYATAFFSAPMRNIVFNPNWTVPPTIVKEDIAPKLQGPQRSGGLFGGRESRNRMLSRYGLTVSKGGKPVDADAVDWQNVNVHSYTFQQDPGPHNVLGQFKFNFPNKHAIYMHDTTQKELFARRVRTLSHGCIRVNQPANFAAFLLGEDKGWSMGTVQDVLARAQGQTKVITLEHNIPVHLTYNTAIADGYGSIQEFGDVYGIDNRMAAKLFKNPAHFNVPVSGAEFAETSPTQGFSEPRQRSRRSANSVDSFISGILGN